MHPLIHAWGRVVFESPVWSSFLTPQGLNRNRNRSALLTEVKKKNQTEKRLQTAVLTGL